MPPPSTISTALVLLLAAAGLKAQDTVRLIAMPHDGSNIFERSVSIERTLDEELLRDWRRLRDQAVASGAKVLILEITCAGGELAVANAIADDFLDLRNRGIRVCAYVPTVATGAAALVALEADTLIMGPEARVGDADPATMEGGTRDGADPANLRQRVLEQSRLAARRARHPEIFVEAMIDPDVEIYEIRRRGAPIEFMSGAQVEALPAPAAGTESRELIVRRGETLTMSAGDAAKFGFPIKSASARSDLLRALGMPDRDLDAGEVLELPRKDVGGASWFHIDWSLILLAAGLLFLILEIKTPGLGLNGILGILALSAYFLVNAGANRADSVLSIGLLLVGFLLLLVEIVFLPGFGVPGFVGVTLILFSIYAASINLPGATLRDHLVPDSPEDFELLQAWLIRFVGSLIAGAFGAILLAPRLHHLPFLNKAFLSPQIAAPGARAAGAAVAGRFSTPHGEVRIESGAHGIAETDLRPAGIARIRGVRADVVTDGEYVARGARVVVTAVEGHRIVVKPEPLE